ncbi:MAG TPA: DUF5677 domain-containing protein [Stellaceae bacterium]|nr:DUF5677 domain-containing protein [Stellaceae bacterium]
MNFDLRHEVKDWLAVIKPMLLPVENYKWVGPSQDQFWEFLRRGAIMRQYEALHAALIMADASHAQHAVTFLRPAFEELLWIEYLAQHPKHANELARLLAFHESADNLFAQNEYLGGQAMSAIGFTQHFAKVYFAQDRKVQSRLREIGRELGWKMDRSLLPSTFFLAKQVKREQDYRYLYQGTSRFVHFSAVEICRRVWGESGNVTIGSTSFTSFWEAFALYWGFRTLVDLLVCCGDILADSEEFQSRGGELIERWKNIAPVPIITLAELRAWPENGS